MALRRVLALRRRPLGAVQAAWARGRRHRVCEASDIELLACSHGVTSRRRDGNTQHASQDENCPNRDCPAFHDGPPTTLALGVPNCGTRCTAPLGIDWASNRYVASGRTCSLGTETSTRLASTRLRTITPRSAQAPIETAREIMFASVSSSSSEYSAGWKVTSFGPARIGNRPSSGSRPTTWTCVIVLSPIRSIHDPAYRFPKCDRSLALNCNKVGDTSSARWRSPCGTQPSLGVPSTLFTNSATQPQSKKPVKPSAPPPCALPRGQSPPPRPPVTHGSVSQASSGALLCSWVSSPREQGVSRSPGAAADTSAPRVSFRRWAQAASTS